MSGKLPAVTGAEVVRALGRSGFVVARIRGSHHVLRHPDGRGTSCQFTPEKRLDPD